MSCGVGCIRGSDLALLWQWCRLEAIDPIRPLAWEHPYAMTVALKRQKERERQKEKKQASKKQRKKGKYNLAGELIRK